MQIAPYFRREEFACKCGCGFDTVDVQLLPILVALRNEFGATRVHSGCRCPMHNREVGGAPNSMHTRGRAADVSCERGSPEEWKAFVRGINRRASVGIYQTYIHIDTRSGAPSFWSKV